MFRLSRGMMSVAILFALSGCAADKLSLGSIFPAATEEYQISGSEFDEAFQMAHRAMEELEFETYNINKDEGKITARIIKSIDSPQDVRTITTKPPEFEFTLKRLESSRLVFTIESRTGGERYIDEFLEQYNNYVDFKQIGNYKNINKSRSDDKPHVSEQIITEIRTGSPIIYETHYELSKQETIEIQVLLYRLGYDPGPATGTMNSKTMDAIEKFKTEHKVLEKIF